MSEKLLGIGPLGQGGGIAAAHTRFAPAGPYYLVNDTFTTNRSAGAVNGTDAEPGPGRRTAADTNSKLSLSGGDAVFATGGVTAGDPGLWYAALDRAPGRILLASASYSAGGIEIGWDLPGSGNITDCVRMTGTTLAIRASLTALTVGAAAASTTYQVAVVQRVAGNLYFIKGGAFTSWTLIWIGAAGAGVQPNIVALTSATAARAAYIRVPAEKWLPTPLVSDGFSAWGTSDGLGHAEGVAGGLGSGGGGLAITSYYGTWGAAGGVASCSALTAGIGLAGRDVGTADMIASVKVTRSAGVAGLFVREDADDRVMAVHDGTNAQLIKRVGGVDTTLINTAATYVAGAELRLICQGTAFRLFYGDVAIGSEQTISDASLQSETLAGVYTTDTGNSFDDLVVYARGTGNEYAALDTVGNPLANAAWTGATWALDGSGRAYNVPTLGAELLTNGGLEPPFLSGIATGWLGKNLEGGGAETLVEETTIVHSGTSQKITVDNSTEGIVQYFAPSTGVWYAISAWLYRSSGGTRVVTEGIGLSFDISFNLPLSAWHNINLSSRSVAPSSNGIQILSNGAASFYVDDVSIKSISLPTTITTIVGTSATQIAAAKIHTLTTGTQAGGIILLDDPANPQNFIIWYHDGTGVTMDKCVAGVYTNLIPRVTVAFSSTAQGYVLPIGSNQFQLWYNGSQRGSNVTVSDAGIISNTRYGLFSTYEGNVFTEFSLDDYVVPFDLPGA